MPKNTIWTEKEINKLKFMYVSDYTFEEIHKAIPNRTGNAIRQKASRLGLKRPTISHHLYNSHIVLKYSNEKEGYEGYLFKCSGCGGWMHVNIGEDDRNITIVCNSCDTICKYIT